MLFNLKYDQRRIRKYHYFMLLGIIQKEKQISRAQLAKLTKMSNTSVGKIIRELIEDELVIEVGQTKGSVGRKATLLEINPTGAYIIGVEIQLNIIRIAIVSLKGDIKNKCELIFNYKQSPETVLDLLADKILHTIAQMDAAIAKKILAIGISIPGLVTWPAGEIITIPQLHWKNVKIKSILEHKLDYIVCVDNDVRAVLLAESLFGCMTQHRNVAGIYIGSGVGGAVMINDELLRGHSNTLGEIGHMTINPDGVLCDCGRLGCLQTYLCSTALQKQIGKPIEEIIEAYVRSEDWAVQTIHRARKYLSITIANITCIYNPEAILITGPMIQDFPIFFEGVEEQAHAFVWKELEHSLQVKLTVLEKDNGVIGASALVLKEFLRHSNDEI